MQRRKPESPTEEDIPFFLLFFRVPVLPLFKKIFRQEPKPEGAPKPNEGQENVKLQSQTPDR